LTINISELKIPTKFETERLILRPYQKGDGNAFYQMLENGNRLYLKESLGSITKASGPSDVETWVTHLSDDWKHRKRFILSVWTRLTEEFKGHIWIEPIDWNIPQFEIGWFVEKYSQGQGIVTEAAMRSLEFLFENLNAHKITVRIRESGPHKEQSKRIAEKCGFTKEGYLRHTVKLEDGTLISENYYGLLKSDSQWINRST
jgi:RimJ/RimL family protein N-acetyltransferase